MAAEIGHPAPAMAQAGVQGQAGHHGGRTCGDCRAGTERGAAGFLRTAVAYRRVANGRGLSAGGGCGLEQPHDLLLAGKKLKSRGGMGIKPALIRFGAEIEAILKRRPAAGPLFPYLRTVRAGDRATEFHQRCVGLEISGVSLHSYRYAWAERALKCGYPERFAQQALGHNSKAVHHAYSKHAEVTVPSLDDWEKDWQENPQRERATKVAAGGFPVAVGRSSRNRINVAYLRSANAVWLKDIVRLVPHGLLPHTLVQPQPACKL